MPSGTAKYLKKTEPYLQKYGDTKVATDGQDNLKRFHYIAATLVVSAICYAQKGIPLGDESFSVSTVYDDRLLQLLKDGIDKDSVPLKKSLARLLKIDKQVNLDELA